MAGFLARSEKFPGGASSRFAFAPDREMLPEIKARGVDGNGSGVMTKRTLVDHRRPSDVERAGRPLIVLDEGNRRIRTEPGIREFTHQLLRGQKRLRVS